MIYEYLCPQHGRFAAWATMEDRHTAQACSRCGVVSPFAISAPRVFSDHAGYISPASGKWVEGRKARTEDFARTNTRPYDLGEKEEHESRKRLVEAQQDAAMEAAIDQTLVELKNG